MSPIRTLELSRAGSTGGNGKERWVPDTPLGITFRVTHSAAGPCPRGEDGLRHGRKAAAKEPASQSLPSWLQFKIGSATQQVSRSWEKGRRQGATSHLGRDTCEPFRSSRSPEKPDCSQARSEPRRGLCSQHLRV